jgi:NAD(P)-dependent dehydrogenase (short-subunit alcohol dehydrogenase family)
MPDLPSLAQLLSLQGRRALITGAAAGIGMAIARRYAEAGAELDLVDVDAAALNRARDELSASGLQVRAHAIDLSRKDEIDALWSELAGSEPDILVNNAGIYPFMHFTAADEAFCRRVMETNLFSVLWMCQHMIRQRRDVGGVIINLGSIEAILPFKEDLAYYSVSKAGVIALTRALAKEHAGHGFRVNAIIPGGIVTQGTMAAAKGLLHLRLDLLKTAFDFRQRLPVGRFGHADEVARVALVLASDVATYVHGAAIPVDGGFLAA